MREIFAFNTSDKGLILRMYKLSTKLTRKVTKIYQNKVTGNNRKFSEQKKLMAI